MEAPEGVLSAQPNPNITVMEKLNPVAMFQKGDKWMFDMGQNMVGFLNIMIHDQQPSDTITLRFAELLTPDSLLYTANLRSAEATDRYVIARPLAEAIQPDSNPVKLDCFAIARNDEWHPTFVYHGFRYVEISGLRQNQNSMTSKAG